MPLWTKGEWERWRERVPFNPERGDSIEEAVKCTRNRKRSIMSDQYMIDYADGYLAEITKFLGIKYEKYDFMVLHYIQIHLKELREMCDWLAQFEDGWPCDRGITCPYGTPRAKNPDGCAENRKKGKCWLDAAKRVAHRMYYEP